jgi:hypothetical protein
MYNIVIFPILFVVVMISSVQYTYAAGPEHDYDEAYRDVPGAAECWSDGYRDGQDNPFDHERNDECKAKGNQYYRAFIVGCGDVEGNTRESCESATDN